MRFSLQILLFLTTVCAVSLALLLWLARLRMDVDATIAWSIVFCALSLPFPLYLMATRCNKPWRTRTRRLVMASLVGTVVLLPTCFALFAYHDLSKKTRLHLRVTLSGGREVRIMRDNHWEVHCPYWAEWWNGLRLEARQPLGYWGAPPQLTVLHCGDVAGIIEAREGALAIYDFRSGRRCRSDEAGTTVAQRLLQQLSACSADPIAFAK